MTPSKQAMDRAKEIMAGAIPAWNVLQHLGETTTLQRDIAAALDEQLAGVKFERDQFEKAAEEWMEAYDALKNKYEPSRGATS